MSRPFVFFLCYRGQSFSLSVEGKSVFCYRGQSFSLSAEGVGHCVCLCHKSGTVPTKETRFDRHVRIVRFLFTTLFVGNWTVSASLLCPYRRYRDALPTVPFSLSVCLSFSPSLLFAFESSLAPVLLCLSVSSIYLSLPTELVPHGRRLGVKTNKTTTTATTTTTCAWSTALIHLFSLPLSQ